MAFAPHTNDRRNIDVDPVILGQFREKDSDNLFEFAQRRPGVDHGAFAPGFPHLIYVGQNGETRVGRVLKTVAYVVVDEDSRGDPVIEKWQVKPRSHREYRLD